MNKPKEFDIVTTIDIEPSSGCTRKCSFCDPGVPRHRRDNPTYLSLDVLRDICSELIAWDFGGIIFLAGHGESFMHPQISEILKICSRVGCGIGVFTNGDLLTEKFYDIILETHTNVHYDQYSINDLKVKELKNSPIAHMITIREQYLNYIQAGFNSRCGAVWAPSDEKLNKVKNAGCECIQHKICLASDNTWYCCCMDIKHHHHWAGGLHDLFSNQEYLVMRDRLKVWGPPQTPRLELVPCRWCETTDQ